MLKTIYHKVQNDLLMKIESILKKQIKIESHKNSALINKYSLIQGGNEGAQLIVSLTTFGERIRSVYITLESIARQTKKPNKVILWLAEDEFKNKQLPISLNHFMDRGLEIRYCKDIKSYKKLVYAVEQFPKDLIITIDDDVIYDTEMIEHLYNAHLKYPKAVCCHRSHVIRKDKNGKVLPYNLWGKQNEVLEPSRLQFPTGVGGVLYFPSCFDYEFFDEKTFVEMAPTGDDFWFKAMTLKNNILTYNPNIYSEENPVCLVLESSKIDHLAFFNVIQGKNDVYMQNLVKKYKFKF